MLYGYKSSATLSCSPFSARAYEFILQRDLNSKRNRMNNVVNNQQRCATHVFNCNVAKINSCLTAKLSFTCRFRSQPMCTCLAVKINSLKAMLTKCS